MRNILLETKMRIPDKLAFSLENYLGIYNVLHLGERYSNLSTILKYLCLKQQTVYKKHLVFIYNSFWFRKPLYWANLNANYMFKVIKRNTRARCKICSELAIKTPERRHWGRSGVFIVNFKLISHVVLGFLLLPSSW